MPIPVEQIHYTDSSYGEADGTSGTFLAPVNVCQRPLEAW